MPTKVFEYSLDPGIYAWFGMSAFVIFAVIVYLWSGYTDYAAAIFTSVIGLLALYFSLHLQYMPVRHATFFEEGFVLEGRGLKREFDYSQIANVSKFRNILNAGMLLYVKNEAQPFILSSNPSNRHLKLDLFAWLRQKAS